MKMLNSTGPSVDPLVAPLVTGLQASCAMTLWAWPQVLIHLMAYLPNPYSVSLSMKMLWETIMLLR